MQLQLSFLFVMSMFLSFGHAQPALIKWGELVEHIPTAVSHQSSTVVHSSVPQRTPLLTPAVRSFVVSSVLPAATYVHNHAPLAWRYLYTAPSTSSSAVRFYGN
ncbi:retinin [Drosophila innubila]|uniref:retinin n=1 Tax=Drosophila innubila TaxID=198719 RepID=UPI00148D3B29|nr:retinin [Drosophila innubila]